MAKPSEVQYRWHELERTMFIHFAPNSWQDQEYDNRTYPISEMNPTELNTNQWCEVAKSWGAKMILFVAKHVGGFCWWPTVTTDYSVSYIPWKEGKGDVLGELIKSCKQYNLELGVYVYPGDYGWGAYIGGGGKTADASLQEAYNQAYRKQLEEVFEYQYLHDFRYKEIWFDGSCGVDISDLINEHGAEAVIFQSPLATIRWCGTESGKVNYPAWSSLDSRYLKMGIATGYHSEPDGDAWAPVEVDTTLYNHNWFWSKQNEKKRKSLEELMDFYYQSAGRGAVALLNAAPTCTGAICEEDVKLYQAFGAEIIRRFDHPLGIVKENTNRTEIVFEEPTWINHVIIMEDYRQGENIRKYSLEGLKDGRWQEIAIGSMVGRKRIEVFEEIQVEQLRVKILESKQEATIRAFEAYHVDGVDIDALVKRLSQTVEVHGESGVTCFEWSGEEWQEWQELFIDLSQYVRVPGQYEIKFEAKGIEIKDEIGILEGHETLYILTKIDGNVYNINRTSAITENEITAMKCKIRCRHNKSQGKVVISPR